METILIIALTWLNIKLIFAQVMQKWMKRFTANVGCVTGKKLTLAAFFFYMMMLSQVSYSQWTQQGPKLVGAGGVGFAFQGRSVSVSADGNTVIVGGSNDNNSLGAAWVFTRSGGVWTQQGPKLVGTGAVGSAMQGSSVSISSDGNTVIVGGDADNNNTGAAWVFTRSGGIWTQQGPKLVGTGAVGTAAQGNSVSISSDGNTAIVGGYYDNSGLGAAWVFTRSGGVWTQQGPKLVGTGAVGTAVQGSSISISSDGNTVIIGGYNDNNSLGAAWVFTRSGGVWTQQGPKLVGTGAVGSAWQGNSVSISSDGNTAIVGGNRDNASQGATWVFTRSSGVWTQQGPKLVGTGAEPENPQQGGSVSISSDGNTAIVGGWGDNYNAGAAWVFTRSGGVWTQQGPKLVGTGAVGTAAQGNSVSISSDGSTAIVGGHYDNSGLGAAWVFSSGFSISKPQAGEKWIAGETDTIRWIGGQAGQFLQIDYSLDNGQTYITIDFAIPADSQYYVWNIPSTLLSTRSKIKLTDLQTSTELAVSDSFKVKGYVLTRLDANGQYVAFSSAAHGWSYPNGTLWPQSWFSQFQYSTATDPYTNEPYPNFFHSVPDSSFVDWPLWVEVFGEDQCYWFTQITGLGSSYKGEAQVKWKRHANKHRGSCFGFAASSFLAFNFPNQFFPRHPGIPNVSNIFVLNLTNTIQKVINGYFAYQFGKQSLDNDVTGITKDPRTTLIEVMNMFKNDVVDISTITIFRNPPPGSGLTRGAHTMAPISVTVDNTGASRYRVNLYDSNNPGLNTPYILVDSLNNTWQDFTGLGLFWNGSNKFYLEIPVSNYLNTPLLGKISHTKNQYVSGINNVEFYNTEKANIIYTASSGNKIGVINGNLINEIPNSIPIYIKNGAPSDPIGYYIPDDIYSVVMDNITDSEGNAYLSVFKEDLAYSYERFDADSLQTDRFYVDEGFSVFSNDNSEKLVNLTMIAEPDSIERIFFIRNSVLRQNDSVYIKEIDMSDLIIKNYGEAKTYDLEINERSSQEEEVFGHVSISLPSVTSHTFIPDWDDLDGSPIAILVDNGINGTVDDTLYVQNTVDVEDQGLLLTPNNYNLAQNYPNPFNPTTTIQYSIPQRSYVILKVYDMLGKEVATIVNEEKDRGVYSVNFDASQLASGIYLYRLTSGTFIETKKMILIK